MPTLTQEQFQELLTNLPPGVKLEIQKTPGGQVALSINHKGAATKQDFIKEKYSHLMNQPITISEASEKYDVPRPTIQSWLYRSKYFGFMNRESYPQTIDEAEIAYCAEIYHQRKQKGIGPRTPLLDEHGFPYELKHPGLAEYRKRKRKQS
jgi:hypothetical protein